MVNLVTQPPEVAPVAIDTRIGRDQRASGGFFGALAEGLTAGIRTLDSARQPNGEEVDQELFDALIGVNPQGAQELDATLGKIGTKNAQTGSTKDRLPSMLASIRKATAAGVPPDVIARSVSLATGSSAFQLERLLDTNNDKTETPRDRNLDFLKSQNQNFTPDGRSVLGLNDQELAQFAFEQEEELNKLTTAQRKHQLLVANEGVAFEDLKDNLRRDLLPKTIKGINNQLSSFLQENIADFPTEEVNIGGGVIQTRLRIDQMNPEDLLSLKNTIRDFKQQFLEGINSALLFRGTAADRAEVAQMGNFYFDEVNRILDGTGMIENLTDIANMQQALSTDEFFRRNPGARDAITAASELGRIVQNLGLEGFQLKEDLANTLFTPLMKGVVVNAADHLNVSGITDEFQQAQILRVMADYISDPQNDLQTKGVALRNLLPNLTRAGVDDANVYQSMLEMMTSPDGLQRVIESMDSIKSDIVREDVRLGFANYRDSFQAEFQNLLGEALSRPVIREAVPRDELTNTERQLRQFSTTGEVSRGVGLDRFVSDNLFQESSVELNLTNLEGLTDAQRARVETEYRKLRREFSDKLQMMDEIQRNFFDAQEQAAFRPSKPEGAPSESSSVAP